MDSPIAPPVTYRQIAQIAGVSNFAVSCALRNRPGVSAETRERIRAVALKMGYTPNPMVAAFMEHQRRQRKTSCRSIIAYLRNFGPVVERQILEHKKMHSTHAEPLNGAREMSQQQGFILEVFPFEEFRERPDYFFRILRARGVSGIIVHSERFPENWRKAPDWKNYTLASTGGPHVDLSCDYSCGDNHGNTWMLLNELRALGYRRIGLALLEDGTTDWMDYDKHRHLSAFHGWHARHGHTPPPVWVAPKWSQIALLRWVKRHRLDAIVAIDRAPLDMLRESGLRVPEDIGFAHLDMDGSWHDIAGIRTNNHLVGMVAAQLIIEQINRNARGIPERPRAFYLPGEWRSGPTARNRSA